MNPKVGDPVVLEGVKYRVLRITGVSGYVLLKQRFGGKAATVRPEDLAWDPSAGVWRVR
jgi:hypothetical protein